MLVRLYFEADNNTGTSGGIATASATSYPNDEASSKRRNYFEVMVAYTMYYGIYVLQMTIDMLQ